MNNPTIRTLVGATAPTTVEAKNTALLVIDFQNEYFNGKMPIPDGLKALNNAKRLVAFADKANMQVIHVQHVTPAGAPIFAEDGETVKFHSDLQPAANHKVQQKGDVSVFVNTDIDAKLKADGIKTLIISGLMTHACVAGAARDGAAKGYEVIVADDACATRDLDLASGGVVPHAALHSASLAGIADTFGDIMSTEQVLNLKLA